MTYNPNIPYNDLPDLPPVLDRDTTEVILNHAVKAARSLAELKGLCETLPGESIMNLLVNTIILQESRDSSAIENIVTTQDELITNESAREVLSYREALYSGLEYFNSHKNLITTNLLINVVQIIKQNKSGIRKTPGVVLKSSVTGEVIYTPPCCEDVLKEKLKQLERFINEPNFCKLDPVIKLALIHYQFESIHPFGDGNGRTGRILNSLYLVHQDLLPLPVLYLSSYIIDNKQDYYQLLRGVTEKQNWRDWILFMITALNTTALLTIEKIRGILNLQKEMKPETMAILEKFNNREKLYELMFTVPYLKIDLLVKKSLAHRQTAALYLNLLESKGILQPLKRGRTTYYLNHRLMKLITSR